MAHMCRHKAKGLVLFQGEKGFLRLFWTGNSLSLCPGTLQVICSSQLVVNISLCWAYLDLCSCGGGGGHKAWKITLGWFAFLSTARQGGHKGRPPHCQHHSSAAFVPGDWI